MARKIKDEMAYYTRMFKRVTKKNAGKTIAFISGRGLSEAPAMMVAIALALREKK